MNDRVAETAGEEVTCAGSASRKGEGDDRARACLSDSGAPKPYSRMSGRAPEVARRDRGEAGKDESRKGNEWT